MMKNNNILHLDGFFKPLISLFILTIISLPAFAQQPTEEWGEEGKLENVTVDIIIDKENTVPPANRHFEKIPPRPAEPISPPIRYDFQSFSFLAPQINPVIRPLKIKAENSTKVYGGYVRAGYGNFGSPLLEGYITSRKDKNKLVGAHLYHFSSAKGPVDGKNSGNGNTTVSVFGRTFNENVALSGRIDAENRTTHFYGYRPDVEVDPSDIKQAYNLFKIGGDLSNAKNSAFGYKLGGQFSYLSDKYDAREMEVDLVFNSAYKVNDDSRFNIDAAYSIINRKDINIKSKARSLFTVSPSYAFTPVEDMKISLGLAVAFENDTIDSKDLHFYPNISVSYPISPSVDLVASMTGGMEKVSLQTLSYENIWIDRNIPIYHTNKYFDLNIAVNAKLGNKVGANAGISIASFKNMHFFVNAINDLGVGDQSKFMLDYEDGFFRKTNLFASISYAQSEKVKLMLRGDVYSMGRDDKGEEPWHLPKYKLNANASFNIAQKFLLNFDVIGQGGMKAWDGETLKIVNLDGALDLNAKVEYLFSESFSIFAQFNNITGTEYPRFYHYPVRGFQFLGGITWSF
jgi:hypothetical protein